MVLQKNTVEYRIPQMLRQSEVAFYQTDFNILNVNLKNENIYQL